MRRVSRKGFLGAAASALAAAPLARAASSPGDRAGAMERHVEPTGAVEGLGGRIIAATEAELNLLVPPRPEPARAGRERDWTLVARDRQIELARGVKLDAFAYNDTVPGPILRATAGDTVRVFFTNESAHPHSIHFHGTHPADMDGSLEPVPTGASYIYEMRANPAGMHLYHCHTRPVGTHIERGLYGAFIVDPPTPRRRAQELVLVMSGFDLNGDGSNELYAFNGRPFQYEHRPIQVRRSLPVRIYLVNVTEHDPVVTFHLHGEVFRLFRTGTGEQFELTDAVTLAQGERCVLEVDFEATGLFMFHAHQSRLTDDGLSGWFQVVDDDGPPPVAGAAGGLYADEFADCTPCLGNVGAKALLKY